MNALILLAAGTGSRMKDSVPDKLLADLNGKAVLLHSLEAFIKSDAFDRYLIVYRDLEQKSKLQAQIESLSFDSATIAYVQGGASRQASVYNALSSINEAIDLIAIHDGARPLVKKSFILRLLEEAQKYGSAVASTPVNDTIKSLEPALGDSSLLNIRSLDRSILKATQTPQVFQYETINKAYLKVHHDQVTVTDEVEALSHYGQQAHLTDNPDPNPKITTKSDLNYILYLLNKNPMP